MEKVISNIMGNIEQIKCVYDELLEEIKFLRGENAQLSLQAQGFSDLLDKYEKENINLQYKVSEYEDEIKRFREGIGQDSRGMGDGMGLGPSGYCKCPNCDYTVSHDVGVPCNQQICPKCGMLMIRA